MIELGTVDEHFAKNLVPVLRGEYQARQLAQFNEIDERRERFAALHRDLADGLRLAQKIGCAELDVNRRAMLTPDRR